MYGPHWGGLEFDIMFVHIWHIVITLIQVHVACYHPHVHAHMCTSLPEARTDTLSVVMVNFGYMLSLHAWTRYLCKWHQHLHGARSYESQFPYLDSWRDWTLHLCKQLHQEECGPHHFQTIHHALRQHLCILKEAANTIIPYDKICLLCSVLLKDEKPACPQATLASVLSHLSSQTVPHWLL